MPPLPPPNEPYFAPSMKESRGPSSANGLGRIAPIAVVAASVGSVAMLLWAGRNSPQHLLMVLFVGWILAPLVALLLAYARSTGWPATMRAALHGLMVAAALISVTSYGAVTLWPPNHTPTFIFVLLPLVLWGLSLLVLTFAAIVARR